MPEKRTDLQNILHGFYNGVGKDPRLQIPLYAAGGAVAGRYGSQAMAGMLIRLMMADKPKAEREALVSRMKQTGRLKTLGTIIGAAGGGLLAANQHWDLSGGMDSFLKSMKDPEYWKDPARANEAIAKGKQKIDDTYYKSTVMNTMDKQASFNSMDFNKFMGTDSAMSSTIPVHSSLNLIEHDEYLDPFQKSTTSSIIENAEGGTTGLISKHQLAKSALQAGAGFLPAYAFGRTVGGILAMPPPVTDRLSKIGGVASAILNTGIFS